MRLMCKTMSSGSEPLPLKHAKKEGENLSPPLNWSDVPTSARELAVIFEDVTAEGTEAFVQWLIYGIPADHDELPEGIRQESRPPELAEAAQGRNSLGHIGYDGPVASEGKTSKYRFRLLAFDKELNLPPELNRTEFEDAASDSVIDEATLVVPYERGGP